MPTYEYECSKCGVFDLFQKMSDDPIQKCPTCKRKVRRLLGTGAGLLFKGSGFYETDYRSDSYTKGKAAEKKSSESKSSGSKSGDKKSGGGSASGGKKSSGDK